MKTGSIAAAGGLANPAVLDSLIVPASVATGTLASIVQSIFDNTEDLLCVLVDFAGRRVRAKVAASGVATAAKTTLLSATGATNAGYFTRDENKRISTWTMAGQDPFDIGIGGENELQDLIKPIQPLLSSTALLGKFEDYTLDPEAEVFGMNCVAVLDQGDGKVHFVIFDTEAHKNTAVTAFGATIGYDQTVTPPASETRDPLE